MDDIAESRSANLRAASCTWAPPWLRLIPKTAFKEVLIGSSEIAAAPGDSKKRAPVLVDLVASSRHISSS
jgi:hypothetical protein